MIQGSSILGQGYSWCKGPEVGMSLGSRKRPVWLGGKSRLSSDGAFLGHAGETEFPFKGDGNCWRIRKEGDPMWFVPAVPSGKWGRGVGLSEEQLTPRKCVAHQSPLA